MGGKRSYGGLALSSGVGGEIRHDIYSCYTRIAHRAHTMTIAAFSGRRSPRHSSPPSVAVAGQRTTHNPTEIPKNPPK